MIKKITGIVLSTILALSLFSCATTKVNDEEKKDTTETVEVTEDKVIEEPKKTESTDNSTDNEEITLVVDEEKETTDESKNKESSDVSSDSEEITLVIEEEREITDESENKESSDVSSDNEEVTLVIEEEKEVTDESEDISSDSEEVTLVVDEEETKKEITKTTLTKSKDSFFWTVTGKDKNGDEANLYVLGTFHVGDDRIYPLHEDVEQAFVNSDRYVSEIASKDFVDLIPETQARMLKSNLRETKLIEANGGKTYIDNLKPVHVALLKELSGTDEFLKINSQFEPWVLLQNISNMPIIMSGLDPNKGLDTILLSRLQNEGKETLGLDELSLQLDILEFGNREEQIQTIESTLDEILEDPKKVIDEIKDFYEAYITGNEKSLKKIVKKTFTEAETDYEKQLNEIVLTNRNISWAKKFEDFLNEGGNTFIFAGCAHFIGDESVFNYMKKNGVFDK